MAMKNFNKLIFESLIDKSIYQFSNDENGNIFCTFSIGNDYIVHAKVFNDVLTFNVTDKDGNSDNLSEKDFSFNHADDYENFKEKLNEYKLNGFEKEEKANSKIENFNEQLKDVESSDPNVKLNKDLTIDGKIFNFKILNDLMVENYCQCIFEFYDEKQNEQRGVRSLLFIKSANSIIIKIILLDEKGQILQNMTDFDFKINYPKEHIIFKKAISKFEEYMNLTK